MTNPNARNDVVQYELSLLLSRENGTTTLGNSLAFSYQVKYISNLLTKVFILNF